MTPKDKPHYVDNAKLLQAMIKYKKALNEAEASGLEAPPVPKYICECILKIATRFSYGYRYINYSYREDMILDGVENCIRYIHNFDSEKSGNPFSYFTQIIYYAFLRRIAKEKKQTYLKNKLIQEIPFDAFELQEHDEDGNYTNGYIEFMQNHANYDNSYEEKLKEKKMKKKKKDNNLEEFITDNT